MSLIVIVNNITDPNREQLTRSDGTADYDYEVSINRRRWIATGEIKGFKRNLGAKALLQEIVNRTPEGNE